MKQLKSPKWFKISSIFSIIYLIFITGHRPHDRKSAVKMMLFRFPSSFWKQFISYPKYMKGQDVKISKITSYLYSFQQTVAQNVW